MQNCCKVMKRLNPALFSSVKMDWTTPQAFFDDLDAEFHFTLDPCASAGNAKCGKFYTNCIKKQVKR